MFHHVVHRNQLLNGQEGELATLRWRRHRRCHNLKAIAMFLHSPQLITKRRMGGPLTFACSIAACAAFSASRCRLSFSFNEKMATDLARFTRLCFNRDFLAANSAAFTAASSSDPIESLPASIDSLWWVLWAAVAVGTAAVDEEEAPGLSALVLEVEVCGLS